MFFRNSLKNYNPEDPLHYSGSQMGLFELKKSENYSAILVSYIKDLVNR